MQEQVEICDYELPPVAGGPKAVVKWLGVDPEHGLDSDLAVVSARTRASAGRAEVEAEISGAAGPGFGFLSNETLRFMNGTVREVLRGGSTVRVASKDLVPGDIVINLSARGSIQPPRTDYQFFARSDEFDKKSMDEHVVLEAFEQLPYERRAHYGELAVNDMIRAQRQHASAGNFVPADMLILEIAEDGGDCTVDMAMLTGSHAPSLRAASPNNGGNSSITTGTGKRAKGRPFEQVGSLLDRPEFLWHKTQLLSGKIAKAIVLATHEKTLSSTRSLAMLNGSHMNIRVNGLSGEENSHSEGEGTCDESEEVVAEETALAALDPVQSINGDEVQPFVCSSSSEQAAAATLLSREHATKFMTHYDEWQKLWDSFVTVFSQCATVASSALSACDARSRLQAAGFDKSQRNNDRRNLSGFDPASHKTSAKSAFKREGFDWFDISNAPVEFEDSMRRLRLGHRFLEECLDKAKQSCFMVRETCRSSSDMGISEFFFEELKDGGSELPSLKAVLELVMQRLVDMEQDYDLAEAILASCLEKSASQLAAADWTRYTLLLAKGRAK